MIPALEEEPWPTLGPQVCAFIETNLVFGPGDLMGKRAVLDPEKRGFIYRMYEVYPENARDLNGRPVAGRRRFRRCAIELQKGTAKTELAAWIAAAELSPEGPVRCDGFSGGEPVGRPVVSPYVPLVAYTEEQTEDLAYGALRKILEMSAISHQFDIGIERILRADGHGKAVALAGSPNSRDGALTTFQHKDETHRWTIDRLLRASDTMIANLPKRFMSDPWELETTTAFTPGEGSVAEKTAEYADDVATGRISDSRLFYFRRWAETDYDLTDRAQLREAVLEAAGPTAGWRDIDGIVDLWQNPKADKPYLERVWLNRRLQASAQAFDIAKWNERAIIGPPPVRGLITLGFDGSLNDDATALIATRVSDGHQWPIRIWLADGRPIEWEDVDATVDLAFEQYQVWRMYGDPSRWETYMSKWAGKHGRERVIGWPTTAKKRMALALKAYNGAINAGHLTHNGDPVLTLHLGQAVRDYINIMDDDGTPLWCIRKDRPNSPKKIDAAMAACLSWAARLDAVAAGAKEAGNWLLR